MHAAFRVEQPRTFLIAPDEDDSEIENRTYEEREEGEGGSNNGFPRNLMFPLPPSLCLLPPHHPHAEYISFNVSNLIMCDCIAVQ